MKKIKISKDSSIPYEYVSYVSETLKRLIISSIDDRVAKKTDRYFSELFSDKNINWNTKQIITFGANNLTIKIFPKYYVIDINDNICIPTTKYKIKAVCKLINDGNLEVKEYPIFDDCIDNVAEMSDMLYHKWRYGL